MAKAKNFVYGDIWANKPKTSEDEDRRVLREDPAKFTSNGAFVKYIEESGYKFYLDYGYQGYAHTDVTNKNIVVNANYSDQMISSFLQHELGHLMLFDVNQFVTIGSQTLRSVIARVIYTPENLVKFGITQLLYTENIIQDIIIETVSNNNCVCHNGLSLYGENMGVKHLESLESAEWIAKEVCKNVLKTVVKKEDLPDPSPEDLDGLLGAMIDGISVDIAEIQEEMARVKKSTDYHNNKVHRRFKEDLKLKTALEKLEKKVKAGRDPSGRLGDLVEKIKSQIEELHSKQRVAADNEAADDARNREVERLERKLAKAEEIRKHLEEERSENSEALGNGKELVDSNLYRNYTDHLEGGNREGAGGHSYDCGLPSPVTVDRSGSAKNQKNLVTLDTKPKGKKIFLNEDDAENVLSNRIKIPESEYTFFKPNKRELSQTDMLKGKRRLRVSGINVLIGLDVSGSMVNEWSTMFMELSDMVNELKEKLDIENIVYFTYDTQIREKSYDIGDMILKPRGGNSFGYVYQQMMSELPIMQKNEIILVTDCGDNLGFKLEDSCVVERNGTRVVNHVSIIDTENAGFYNIADMDRKSWSIHRHDDGGLFQAIKDNIENLIDE